MGLGDHGLSSLLHSCFKHAIKILGKLRWSDLIFYFFICPDDVFTLFSVTLIIFKRFLIVVVWNSVLCELCSFTGQDDLRKVCVYNCNHPHVIFVSKMGLPSTHNNLSSKYTQWVTVTTKPVVCFMRIPSQPHATLRTMKVIIISDFFMAALFKSKYSAPERNASVLFKPLEDIQIRKVFAISHYLKIT